MSTRKLTLTQQAVLEEHLEDMFRNIERDYNKRTDPESAVPTVDILLTDRLRSLLQLILAIPSIPPTKHLQIAFLLRFTSSAREWIAGYPLLWPSGYSPTSQGSSSSQEQQAEATIGRLLDFLSQLDEGWKRMLVADVTGTGTPSQRDSTTSTVLTATEKIRLQSSIIAFRQTLLRWIARYKKTLDGKKRRQVDPVAGPSGGQPTGLKSKSPVDDSDADASPGIVETTVDDGDSSDIIDRKAEKEEWPGEWEVAIANSLSGTLEIVI